MALTHALAFLLPASRDERGAPSPEAAWLAAAQAGDPVAFERLFERHASAVRRLLGDLLRDRGLADEGTQETFIRAHLRLKTLSRADALVPWLLGIARNVARELRRAQRGRPLAQTEEQEELKESAAHTRSPEALLLGRETEALCDAALRRLPAARRCALLLRLDHGLAYEDIARTMGWSLAKVKNEIHRARRVLREELAPHLEEER